MGAASSQTAYTFDNTHHEAGTQLMLLGQSLDERTQEILARLLVAGDRCLDVGAGAGTIAAWMLAQVKTGFPELPGAVVAFDRKPLHVPAADGLTVVTGDASTHDFGEGLYDVIHVRLLLMHLRDREAVLAKLVRALRPGGRLVVSDWDCTQPERMLLRGSEDTIVNFLAFQRALLGLAEANGASLGWARRLFTALESAGLTEVRADVHSQVWRGGEPGARLHVSNSRQLEQQLLDRGVHLEDLEQMRLALDDPATTLWQYPMVTAVGTRSADA